MAEVTVKIDGRNVKVRCQCTTCKSRPCFHPGYFDHYSTSIDGVRSSWRNKHASCLYRDYHGCPDEYCGLR